MAVERLALSIAEAAEALGCSQGHIRNLIARGELKSFKAGRRVLIRVDVLKEWMKQLEEIGK